MKKLLGWLKSKTVIGAIVVIFGPIVQDFLGIDSAGFAEILQAIGLIIGVIGARDAVKKLEPK